MLFLYTLLLYAFIPLILLRLLVLGIKGQRGYLQDIGERFGFVQRIDTAKRVIWLHAVSVGEVSASAVLVSRIKTCYPDDIVLMTTMTPTGKQAIKRLFADEVYACYLPYDLPLALALFLRRINPQLLLVMETEIWPNLYIECGKRKLPILLLNARLNPLTAQRYVWISRLMTRILAPVNHIVAQSERDADWFRKLSVPETKLSVFGNFKFDFQIPSDFDLQVENAKMRLPGNRSIWIAASTHDGEDECILEAHRHILQDVPDALLIIAPRHPQRAAKIIQLCQAQEMTYVCLSDSSSVTPETQVYLLDRIGVLLAYYALASVAFVGGSLIKHGGQNTLEPAMLGTMVVVGTYTHNFSIVNQLLRDAQVLSVVESASELETVIKLNLESAPPRAHVKQRVATAIQPHQGSVERALGLIKIYL